MINLTINAHDGNLYELTSRYSQPQSSAAQPYRNDPYVTQRLIARFPIEVDTWLHILGAVNQRPATLNTYQAASVHQAVANAVLRGELVLYKLPLLNSATSLRGKGDIGLCLIKGPKPHCSTQLSAAPITSVAAAQELLNEMGIEPKALLAYLNGQNLYNSYDQQKPLDEVLKRLANGELLAYKIPLPPMSVPEKAIELVSAVGPMYQPVPLAPETVPSPKSTPPAPVVPPPPVEPPPPVASTPDAKPVNPELEARAKELEEIGADLRTNGFTPTSDEEIMQAVNSGNLGNRRFLVSVQVTKRPGKPPKSYDEPVGFQRPDTGRTTMWVTTYDMLKKGDTSAPLLMALLGSTYEPTAEYTMFLLDQGENFAEDGAMTFVPTWENMQRYCPEELHKDNPKDPIRDKALLASVMNPETQVKYQQTMEEFWKEGKNEYEIDDIREFLSKKGFSPEERTEFRARHLYRTQIGANAYFLGTGATDFTLHDKNKSAIASDNIKLNGTPGKVGTPEILTIEKDPLSITQLEQKGLLKAIPLKGTVA